MKTVISDAFVFLCSPEVSNVSRQIGMQLKVMTFIREHLTLNCITLLV